MSRINRIISEMKPGSSPIFSKEQVFTSFKQGTVQLPLLRRIGGGGNCASVALIKAAIGSLGFNNIFASVIIDTQNKRYLIDLKDSQTLVYNLSFDDYNTAIELSAFELNGDDEVSKDIFEFARFCFAVMAEVKRTTYRIDKRYVRAIQDLNKGESTMYIHEYLGLTAINVSNVSIQNLSGLKHLLVWNNPHAVYSSEGFYDEFFDGYEDIQPLGQLQHIHGEGEEVPVGAQQIS